MKNEATNKLKNTKCDLCLVVGEIEGIISDDKWIFECGACQKRCTPFKKQIIYLDQNFLSSASSNNPRAKEFILRSERLQDLIHKQLIVCPFSELHIIESSIAGKRKQNLLDFIKKISMGFHFNFNSKIITSQLYCAYNNYNENKQKYSLSPLTAIDSHIHSWIIQQSRPQASNFSALVDNFTNQDNIRKAKEFFCSFISNNISNWHNSKLSLEEHVNDEIKSKINGYINAIRKAMHSTIEEQMNCVELSEIMAIFDVLSSNPMNELDKLLSFLASEYFKKIPYIHIRSGLAALIIQGFKQGTPPGEKAIKELQGLEFDIQHSAIYTPYCDAIFTDRKMASYLRQLKQHGMMNYPCEIFSADNWDEFDFYLDKIESAMTQDMKDELDSFYMWFPPKYGKGANM